MSTNRRAPGNDKGAQDSAYWFTRVNSGTASEHELKGYEKRLRNDPEFSKEQARMAEIWDIALDLESDAEVRAATTLAAEARPSNSQRSRSRIVQTVIATAATLLLVLGTVLFWPGSAVTPTAHHYTTNVGEQKTIHLDDGSILHLNSGTRIQVQLSKAYRQAELFSGEATFKVAADSKRPFEVHTQSGLTRVLGTTFNIEIIDQHAAQVSVLQGQVQVVAGNLDTLLIKNQSVRYDQAGLGSISPSSSDRIRSWHTGRIRFDDKPLKDILDEYNRYSAVKRYVDPRYEAIRFSGSFTLQDKDELIEAIEDAFGILTHTYAEKPHS